MATDLYVTANELMANVQDPESSGTDPWEALALAVSRLFDAECDVRDGFFLPADADSSERTFYGNGTEYVRLDPYVAESIEEITVDGDAVTLDDTDEYFENDGYLIFGVPVDRPGRTRSRVIARETPVVVTARWGFAAVPADVKQACIEQGLFLWRKKDLAFSELSGVPSAVVTAKLSPTFELVTQRYRGTYSRNIHFA